MSWVHATTTVPLVRYACLIAWAAAATVLGGWHWRLCHTRHCGPHACGGNQMIAFDDAPTIPATVAEPGRDTERAAS